MASDLVDISSRTEGFSLASPVFALTDPGLVLRDRLMSEVL